MRVRFLAIIVAAAAVALGLSAAVLSHPGAAVAASKSAQAGPSASSTRSGAARRPASLTTTSTTNTPDSTLPPIKHVFVIVLENESASKTFPTSGTAPAPYLADTMVSQGAFLPNYYGTGHNSNDNYISMISGQAPNTDNSEDCEIYGNFPNDSTTGAPYYQQDGLGCIYPSDIQNIASQLDTAGDSWKDYNEDMGNDPTRESSECGHPAIGAQDKTQSEENGDAYATRHDPFVYFHDIIDDTTLCDTHVVNLNDLTADLQSASTTPNYVFITPNLCHDGHDATCDTPGENGGFQGINDFLSEWVPKIEASPAYKDQNGLIITTFDEAATSDTSDCCGEQPGPGEAEPGLTGKGGGRVGAVLLSPCITPGTVSDVDYDHYSMLGSVENIFGLSHLGYAQLPGQSYFGTDIFTGNCSTPPTLSVATRSIQPGRTGSLAKVPLSFSTSGSSSAVTYSVQVRQLAGTRATAWKTVATGLTSPSYSYNGHVGDTYQLRVQATNGIGLTSAYKTETVVVPTLAKAPGAKLKGNWKYVADAGAWRGHAERGTAGATYTLKFTGGSLGILATRMPQAGTIKVSFSGITRKINLQGARTAMASVFSHDAKLGSHSVTITVLSGTVDIEGLVIRNLG